MSPESVRTFFSRAKMYFTKKLLSFIIFFLVCLVREPSIRSSFSIRVDLSNDNSTPCNSRSANSTLALRLSFIMELKCV